MSALSVDNVTKRFDRRTAVELVLLGRLFRSGLLAQGQRPTLEEMIGRMRGRTIMAKPLRLRANPTIAGRKNFGFTRGATSA